MKTVIAIGALILSTASIANAADPKVERMWKAKCASCHGDDGKAQTEQGKKMAMKDISAAAWQKEMTDEKIKEAIMNGIKEEKNGVKKEMEAYKSKLRPDQIDQLVAFVRGLAK
jgi:mono/diheme cytochrome c family protein